MYPDTHTHNYLSKQDHALTGHSHKKTWTITTEISTHAGTQLSFSHNLELDSANQPNLKHYMKSSSFQTFSPGPYTHLGLPYPVPSCTSFSSALSLLAPPLAQKPLLMLADSSSNYQKKDKMADVHIFIVLQFCAACTTR